MSDPLLGSIIIFAGNFAPRGYAFCSGQILSIAQNTALFSLLGTTYGGNGQTTFALPDLRGRAPIGQGQGPGLANISLGEVAGVESTTILTTQMPAHTHVADLKLRARNASGNSQTPVGSVLAREAAGVTATYSTDDADTDMKTGAMTGTIAPSGGSQPLAIRNPYLGVSYIIAIEGIFPSRN